MPTLLRCLILSYFKICLFGSIVCSATCIRRDVGLSLQCGACWFAMGQSSRSLALFHSLSLSLLLSLFLFLSLSLSLARIHRISFLILLSLSSQRLSLFVFTLVCSLFPYLLQI